MLKIKPLWCIVGVVLAVAAVAGQSRPLEPLVVVRLAEPAGSSRQTARPSDGQPTPGASTQVQPSLPVALEPVQDARRELSPLAVMHLESAGASATLDSVRPLSLRFAQPQQVRDVLLLLVRDTGLSLVGEPGVDGTFIGELNGVTLRHALNLVLHPQGLDYAVDGTAIRVFRRRPETRIFDVNIGSAQRRASGTLSLSSSLAGDAASGSRTHVDWTAGADAFEEIARAIPTLLSPEGRFALDRKAGVLQVTDFADRLDRVSVYIEAIERRLSRQVDIQTRIIEVTLADEAAPGVNWSAAMERARTTSPSGVVTLDFLAFVEALGRQGTVAVLASPRVTALHNEPAVLRIGMQDVTFERQGESERATAMLDGFSLTVISHISADGFVTMNIAPSVTQRTGEVRSREKHTVPVLAVDEMSTAARVRDGETLVLPGMRRQREQTISAPVKGLAALFRRDAVRKTYSEIAVLLTPKVM